MRKSKKVTAESRERILTSASRMLRARGLEGTSLADVMQAAGMTHGGFYKHFDSKEELSELATRAAFAERVEQFDALIQREGREKARKVYFADYLSKPHVEHPESGCPVAAFGADAGRPPGVLAAAFAEGAEMLISRVMSSDDADGRAKAIRKLALVLGAVVVARSVGPGPLRDEILAACADA